MMRLPPETDPCIVLRGSRRGALDALGAVQRRLSGDRRARARLVRDQLVMVGTLRKDGWPRISPCQVDIAAGHLLLGMMWRPAKALDLARDPRVVESGKQHVMVWAPPGGLRRRARRP
jgi:hypothetical protein